MRREGILVTDEVHLALKCLAEYCELQLEAQRKKADELLEDIATYSAYETKVKRLYVDNLTDKLLTFCTLYHMFSVKTKWATQALYTIRTQKLHTKYIPSEPTFARLRERHVRIDLPPGWNRFRYVYNSLRARAPMRICSRAWITFRDSLLKTVNSVTLDSYLNQIPK